MLWEAIWLFSESFVMTICLFRSTIWQFCEKIEDFQKMRFSITENDLARQNLKIIILVCEHSWEDIKDNNDKAANETCGVLFKDFTYP